MFPFESALDAIFYAVIFLAVYAQVFFFVTFLENRKRIVVRDGGVALSRYPAVTVIVPCWNEEGTVAKTVQSVFRLSYPKEKIHLILVDDGSTDGTWRAISEFKNHPGVRIFRKPNGGKHTALNLGLSHTRTEFVGCLDADSVVHPEALSRIIHSFENNPEAMAVIPSIITTPPETIVQKAQQAEYHMGVFNKKMLCFMGAIHVTPGPFTIFRRSVFEHLGPYRSGHGTEDMEIAYRMQKNGYKIIHCEDASVYTGTPSTLGKLYRQRLRWIYGFLNNTIDYRDTLLRLRFGNFSMFTLPVSLFLVLAVGLVFGRIVYNLADFFITKIAQVEAVGWRLSAESFDFDFDPFFFHFDPSLFLFLVVYALVLFGVVLGRKISERRWSPSLGLLYFLLIFKVLAPFWNLQAIWRTLWRKKPAWR